MLHVLRSVQVATVKGEARQISFRDIDVEQIGYIYEGLLGYTCVTVKEVHLGIVGTSGFEPQIPLTKLEELRNQSAAPKELATAVVEWTKEDQPSSRPASVTALAKAFNSEANPSTKSALTQLVGEQTLREQIKPWLGLVRLDLRGYPFVVPTGGLTVKETPSRKNAGAHYTPRSLAEEVVLHALQPLCYSPGPHQIADGPWTLKSSDEILDLKVADIACGSGAFLVAAARYLADRVVEAWISEDPSNAHRKHLKTRALRQVVANCLYGADINDMAVEMCKLSLWLVSLDSDLPFSFVDDKVFVGNSLLGLTSLQQLRKMHIEPSRVLVDRRFDIFDVDIEAIIRKAVDLRERLASEIDEDDPARSSAAKQRQLMEFRRVTADLREIADGVVAAGLPLGGKPGNELDDAYDNLRIAVKEAHSIATGTENTRKRLDNIVTQGLTPSTTTDYERWQPLHWILVAPDVVINHGGFDSVIGNPPFLGGKKVSIAIGSKEREWLVNQVAGGLKGNTDLAAFFFRRAFELVNQAGTLGLIATNSIAQGDTREVGLDALLSQGFVITRSVRSSPWPSGTANLEYAAVWGTESAVTSNVPKICDGFPTSRITSLLEPGGRVDGQPAPLASNRGISFQGCIVLGKGFVLDPVVAEGWVQMDSRIAQVVFPYLDGDDVNSRPDCSARRWVIDFAEMSEKQSSLYPTPWKHVYERVRPERILNDIEKYPRMVNQWWKFWNGRPALRKAIEDLSEVLVFARVSKTVMPVRVSTKQVLHEKLVVFASDSFALQAYLSSSAHQMWVLKYGTTMRVDPTYTSERCFETLPLPDFTPKLGHLGQKLHEVRSELMLRRWLGLTQTYNLVNSPDSETRFDPDIARLREIHVEIDVAVMEAFGWDDVPLDHGFHTYRQLERWTVCPAARVEILDRLLEENHRRAAVEAKQSTPKKPSKARKLSHPSDTLFS